MLFLKKKINKRGKLIIFGLLLTLIGIILIFWKYGFNIYQDAKEDKKINDFYEIQEDIVKTDDILEIPTEEKEEPKTTSYDYDYIAVINIPKINLEKGICGKGSYCNNVNLNIKILDEADYPDVENGNFILASHSGNLYVSYFKNLYKVENNDEITVTYNGYVYKYKVVNIYDVPKTGTVDVVRNKDKSVLTLITCRKGTDNQIVVISELVERTKYNE